MLLFLFVHPISGKQPGKDTLLTIQSGSSIQMGSVSLCVLQLKDCYSTSGSGNLILLQAENDFMHSMVKLYFIINITLIILCPLKLEFDAVGIVLVEFFTVCLLCAVTLD